MQDQGLHRCKVELCTIFWPKIQNIMMMKERQYDDTRPDRPLHLQCSWPWWEAGEIFTTFQSLSPPPCSKWNANWEGGGDLLFLAACSSPFAGDVDSFVSFRVLDSKRWQHCRFEFFCKPLSRLQNRIWTGATSGPPDWKFGVNMYFYSWSKIRWKWKGL